jgi:CRP/FNR family transcriptional regulator, cyclic AMP receptor protein
MRPGMATRRASAGTVELLRTVPIFQGLSRAELRRVVEAGRELEFPPGRMIVQEGSVASDFYLILSGEASVSRGVRTIRRLDTGDFFGEISVLDGGPRSATIVADSRLLAFRLSRTAFLRLLRTHRSIAGKLLQAMATRLRTAERASAHI